LNGLQFPEQLHEVVKKDLFLKQLKGSTLMKFDLECYSRMKDTDPDKSYEWLSERVKDRCSDNRVNRVEFELGYGGNPALAGTEKICKFHAMGTCNRGDSCFMSHDIPVGYVIPKGKGKDSGKGKGKDEWRDDRWNDKGKGKGKDQWTDKGKGKGKGKDKNSGGGRGAGPSKGGNPDSPTPCFAFNSPAGCHVENCRHNHRPMTKVEKATKKDFDERHPKRLKSPGAPAIGKCPDFIKGNCALGDTCPMDHAGKPKAKGKAKAKAKAE
jgi:hypothetical protein